MIVDFLIKTILKLFVKLVIIQYIIHIHIIMLISIQANVIQHWKVQRLSKG